MKVTMYGLLGMIKDGKIPEKIIFNGFEYLYHDKEHGYCRSNYDCTYICIDSEYYLFDILNDTVEIIEEEPRDIEVCGSLFTKSEYDKLAHSEEEKKIPEKLNLKLDDWTTPTQCDIELSKKIDEIIDYLKSKGE